jgi:hypothetical protein
MLQLRRITDRVQLRRATDKVVQAGSQAYDQAARGLTEVGKRGNEAARGAYNYAMNHPKTTAAVVLGAGVAAALVWMMQRNGGYTRVRRQVLQRIKQRA